MSLSDKYNLENDSRLTLPDDTIVIFRHDMKDGHLNGEKVSGGNYIKLAKIPINVRIYWNSKYDRSTAKLLDESNRGMRILKQNDDKRLMTFQNFYLWTEGDLSDIESWTERQRELQVEISGVGAEITPLIANASSEIRVESVDKLHSIRQLEYFGKGDTATDAGEIMNKIATCTCKNTENSTQSLLIQKDILAKITSSDEFTRDYQEKMIRAIGAIQAEQLNYQNQMFELVSEANEILKKIQENGTGTGGNDMDLTTTNLLLTQLNQTQSDIKALQTKIDTNAESLATLVEEMNTKFSTTNESLEATNTTLSATNESLDKIAASVSATAANTLKIQDLMPTMSASATRITDSVAENGLTLTTISNKLGEVTNNQVADRATLQSISTSQSLIQPKIDTNLSSLATNANLTSLKTANHTDLMAIKDDMSTSALQQQLLTQLQSVNINLNNLATLLGAESNIGGNMPSDFNLTAGISFLANGVSGRLMNGATLRQAQHYAHIHAGLTPNATSGGQDNYVINCFRLQCNYQAEFYVSIQANIEFTSNTFAKINFNSNNLGLMQIAPNANESTDEAEVAWNMIQTYSTMMKNSPNKIFIEFEAKIQNNNAGILNFQIKPNMAVLGEITGYKATGTPTDTIVKVGDMVLYAVAEKIFNKIQA